MREEGHGVCGLFVTCWLNLDPKPEDSHEHGTADVQVDTLTYPKTERRTSKLSHKPRTLKPTKNQPSSTLNPTLLAHLNLKWEYPLDTLTLLLLPIWDNFAVPLLFNIGP